MVKKKQSFSEEFKGKVALEALREEKTLQELSVKHGVHPNRISQWKRQAIEGIADIFRRPNKKSESEKATEDQRDELLKLIGTQKLENDFLKKKYRELYGSEPF
jgi:putative transposase